MVFLIGGNRKSNRRLSAQERATGCQEPPGRAAARVPGGVLAWSPCYPHDRLSSQPHGQRLHKAYEERLRDSTITPVPDQVQFRIDFKSWLKTLTARERRIIQAMALNERTKDLARMFEVSPGRVSQLRREFLEGWQRYCGDVDEMTARA